MNNMAIYAVSACVLWYLTWSTSALLTVIHGNAFGAMCVQREENVEEEYEVDDEMALALGFGGFGSSKR